MEGRIPARFLDQPKAELQESMTNLEKGKARISTLWPDKCPKVDCRYIPKIGRVHECNIPIYV
jgi:hypothetical protein